MDRLMTYESLLAHPERLHRGEREQYVTDLREMRATIDRILAREDAVDPIYARLLDVERWAMETRRCWRDAAADETHPAWGAAHAACKRSADVLELAASYRALLEETCGSR
jgi:hypothetical protein